MELLFDTKFVCLYWNYNDFRVNYKTLEEEYLVERHYLSQLINEKSLLYVLNEKNNPKEIWENLLFSFINSGEN